MGGFRKLLERKQRQSLIHGLLPGVEDSWRVGGIEERCKRGLG